MQVLVTLTNANFGGNPLYQATKHLNGEKRNVELDTYLLLIQLFLYPVLGRIFKTFFKCTLFHALDTKTMFTKKQGSA